MSRKNTDPIDSHIANRVRVRREMLGITQAQLAKALRLTVQHVQRHEDGSAAFDVSHLHRLARILKVPNAGFFFEGAPSPAGIEDRANATDLLLRSPTSLEDYEMVRAYLQIKDPKLRRCVVLLVQAVAESARAERRQDL
jgi:transcriptional regulator with XRE-family HTH domain